MHSQIDKLMKEYESMLGEDISNIEAKGGDDDDFADDPLMKQVQQRLNLEQKKANQVQEQHKQQLPKTFQQEENTDDMLNQYMKPPQQQQQRSIPKSNPQQSSNPSLLQFEQQYTNPDELKSFLLMKQEIENIENVYIQQPVVKQSPQLVEFYKNTVNQLKQQITNMKRSAKSGELDATQYLGFVAEAHQIQHNYFRQVEGQKNQFFTMRISKRLDILDKEKKLLEKNPQGSFQKVLSIVEGVPAVQQQQSFHSQVEQPKSKTVLAERPKSSYTEQAAEEIIQGSLDNQPVEEKFRILLQRHKQNHNFISYLLLHFKQERTQEIAKLMTTLERSRKLKEEFQQGQNPHIAGLLMNDLAEVTFERFHQFNQIEYNSRLQILIEQIQKARKDEEQYYKASIHSKPIMQSIPGQTKPALVKPSDIALKNIKNYDQILKYLQLIEKKQWVPLPSISRDEEIRTFSQENKEIPQHVLRIKFKRLLHASSSKYYISYSLEVLGQMITYETEMCGNACVFNYQKDISLGEDRRNNALRDLHTKSIDVRIIEKGFFSNSTVGQGIIKLSELENNHTYEGTIDVTKKQRMELEFGIYLREPLSKCKKKIDVFKINKTYPEFNPDEGLIEFIQKTLPTLPSFRGNRMETEQPQSVQPQHQQPTQQPQQPQQQQQQQQPQQSTKIEVEPQAPPPVETIMLIHMDNDPEFAKVKEFLASNPQLPPGITADDVQNPENPQKACVYNFIDPQTKFFEEKLVEVKQIAAMRPQSRFLQNIWEAYLRQKMIIERQLENGNFQWYQQQVGPAAERDRKLLQIYKQLGLPNWVKFVQTRLQVAEQEINDLNNQ